jgi:M6 family metalloprotease-like protein
MNELTNLNICKTTDLTAPSGVSNGFPRPKGAFIGAISPKILFIPLNFSDTPPFSEVDILRAQITLKEVQDFYKRTSYGLVNIQYEILDKSKWLTINRTAESYGLATPRPQQDNTEALKEILSKVDPSVNFDLYDGVTIETTRFPGSGVAQAFPGQIFPTQNGSAKGVSLQTSMAAGRFSTLAHELGHSLFWLEDLYLFKGSAVSPAGEWDMMSYSSREFLGWSKFLNGWLADKQVRCLNNQTSSVHYLESVELSSEKPKLILINLQEGVTIGVEVRQLNKDNPRGALVYKVDSRVNHGAGPIAAQVELLYKGKFFVIDGWKISALEEGTEGMLINVEKVG